VLKAVSLCCCAAEEERIMPIHVILLTSIAGLCFILFIFTVLNLSKKNDRITELENDFSDKDRSFNELSERFEKKSRQVDKIRNELEQAKEEAKKSKEEAFRLKSFEKTDRTAEEEELDRVQEEELMRAKSKAKDTLEELTKLKEENDRLTTQIRDLKQDKEHERKISAQIGGTPSSDESKKLQELEKENKELSKKLKSAERKSRNNAQVYKITNSKLELALEKIRYLENKLPTHTDVSEEKNNPPDTTEKAPGI
jgi:chromosome segregation ATPase